MLLSRILRILIAIFIVALPVAASAMNQSAVPPKFPIPWANSAGSAYVRSIPTASQIGIQNCAASLTDGFAPLTFQAASAGGCPPFGADFNGILKQITQWAQWQSAGGRVAYDSAFSAAIGGYPKNAVLTNASTPGCYWVSTTDNNTSNPDAGGANWTASCPVGTGVGTTSGGSANAQTVTTTPFTLGVGATVTFVAGLSNTGPLQVNVNGAGLVNVYRRSQLGATMSVGGEVVSGQIVTLQWDGTRYQCTSCQTVRVGKIEFFSSSSNTPPAGTLFIDGSCISQSTFADLFSVVGASVFGSCSAGNFAIPDGRGNALVSNDAQGTNGAASRITSASPSLGGSSCAGNTMGTLCGIQSAALTKGNLPNYNLDVSSLVTALGSTLVDGSSGPVAVLIPGRGNGVGGSNGQYLSSDGLSGTPVNQNQSITPTWSGSLHNGGGSVSGALPLGGSSTPLVRLMPMQVVRTIIQF